LAAVDVVHHRHSHQTSHIRGDIATYKALDLCESHVNCPTQALSVSPNSNTTTCVGNAVLDTLIQVGSDHTDGSPNAPGNPQVAPTGSSVHDHVVVSSA